MMIFLEPGDRIELVHMKNDPHPIPPNTRGTVVSVKDCNIPAQGSLWDENGRWIKHTGEILRQYKVVDVDWDINRSLQLMIPPDIVKRL